jgi:hypothetical protein
MAHSRYGEVAKRVNVRALALPAYLAWELQNRLVAVVPVGTLPPLPEQRSVDNRVEPKSYVCRIEGKRDESESREVLTLGELDKGSTVKMKEVARQQSPGLCCEGSEVTVKRCADRARLSRAARLVGKVKVSTAEQPRCACSGELDSVGARTGGEVILASAH